MTARHNVGKRYRRDHQLMATALRNGHSKTASMTLTTDPCHDNCVDLVSSSTEDYRKYHKPNKSKRERIMNGFDLVAGEDQIDTLPEDGTDDEGKNAPLGTSQSMLQDFDHGPENLLPDGPVQGDDEEGEDESNADSTNDGGEDSADHMSISNETVWEIISEEQHPRKIVEGNGALLGTTHVYGLSSLPGM